jgi:myo-inositol-1(or 4)-monophosphatase
MNLDQIEKHVIEVCREVGEFILQEGKQFDRTKIEQKHRFNNLVSYVDKEAERKLVEVLRKILPEAGFITEEGTATTSSDHVYNWIIDPLDGTTNFMHGLPMYAISIGLARNKEIVLGVVHEMNGDECFHAIEGGAAYCNNEVIKASPIQTLSESLLATGFPYYHLAKKDVYLEIIKEFLAQTHGIRRFGSAAIDLAYVACGRLEGFFEYNLNAWDVAGGAFILQRAGGKVTDFSGGDSYIFGGELCASCTGIHTEMLDIIKPRWGY